MYSVYFAKSLKNNKIYVGLTSKDPRIRIIEHNNGSNAWSKQNRPFELVYFESYVCKEDAMNREKFYKSGLGKQIKYAIVKTVSAMSQRPSGPWPKGRPAPGRG
ncbi:MAG: endonuclease [Candidatus Kerfeldbacteria bacterium CG_4_10_14_0_8_um_filter_42_10]|uniref:Endonuclease n=1 Tax=Candidatus Kerfeldbacteria bacterium CG_4_10_14_0_8_um_filter_42_10 TaxID=2014248 RepID=A0A2M7RIX0_9BACT|nr:MAG: endonuclease [Candidatus Kerfeldbacteria bacterium CG_4_10_14_0_8_um_filter_42_10]